MKAPRTFLVSSGILWALASAAAEREGRFLYVTRWHLRSDAEVASAVAFAQGHGFNALLCQVFGDALALYDSAVAPRSHLVSPGFDALAESVRRGHAAGLEVHAYINTVQVWSGGLGLPSDPEHIVRSHPDWSQENAAGVRDVDLADTPDALLFFCPREPGFVAYLCDVAREIARRYDIDGLHLDYTRYPSEEHCFCPRHREAYRGLYGRDPEPGDPAFNRLREDDVFDLVGAIRQAIASEKPEAPLSATLINPSGRKGQDAQRWLEAGAIDIGVPMLYTDDPAAFESSLRWFHERSGGRHIVPAINVGLGATGPQIDAARAVGAEGVAIFASSIVTPEIEAELEARFSSLASPLLFPWLDGSPDAVAPVLSGVRAAGIGPSEATILWHSDEKTRGAVDYGLTPGYGATEAVGSFSFEHAITIGRLKPQTTYHFRARSTDASGNESRSQDMTFQTGAGGSLEVILDDGDTDVTFTGNWIVGTIAGGYGGDYRWTTDQPTVTATATYRPYLSQAGDWEVAVTYLPGGNRVTDAPYTVEYEGGSETFPVDQKALDGSWVVLGKFRFSAGQEGRVVLANRASGGDVVVADAVRWRYAGNPPFVRGDANADGSVNVADAIAILQYLFMAAPALSCLDALDVADGGSVNIGGAVRILTYLFAQGEPPPPPFPGPGHDPTPTDPYTCGD